MFTSLSIKNFRAFRDTRVEALERVNLIAGANDVGKTALLEAVALLASEGNLTLVPRMNAFRGLDRLQGEPHAIAEWLWLPLFHRFRAESAIRLEGKDSDGVQRKVDLKLAARSSTRLAIGEDATARSGGLSYGFAFKALRMDYADTLGRKVSSQMLVDREGVQVEPPPARPSAPSHFLPCRGPIPPEELAKDYGSLELVKHSYDVLRVLTIVEPRLVRLSTILGPGGTMLYGDIGIGRMLPLALLGDGLSRFAALVLKIATSPQGVVLVDEMENGLHHKVLRQVWAAIAEAARRFDVQLFATTHSWECIQAAHEAFTASGKYDFRLHRLDRKDDQIRAVTYDQEVLGMALKAELEVR